MNETDLQKLLFELEKCMHYSGDGQIVQCPCCAAACTIDDWLSGLTPEHTDDCEWMAARRVLGIFEAPGAIEAGMCEIADFSTSCNGTGCGREDCVFCKPDITE